MEYESMISPVLSEYCEEGYLRRLSLYATLRADDLKTIVSTKKQPPSRRSRKTGWQSLQNLFATTNQCQTFVPDEQGVSVIVEEESSSSSTESLNEQKREYNVILVNGEDVQDLPVEYKLEGIQGHEFPVIDSSLTSSQRHHYGADGKHHIEPEQDVPCMYIDRRVCPGFRYRVRYPGSQAYVFDGHARVLQSIGMGYGKRMTFKGDRLNINDCYFWSDSHEEGFAFSLQIIQKGDTFVLYDDLVQPIADVVVENADAPQVEESMEANGGNVKKVVRVRFTCTVSYHQRFHGNLVEMKNKALEVISGLAEVVKSRNEKEAKVQRITDVFVSRVGRCTLWKE